MDGRGPKAEGKFDKSNSIVFLDFGKRDRFYVHSRGGGDNFRFVSLILNKEKDRLQTLVNLIALKTE